MAFDSDQGDLQVHVQRFLYQESLEMSAQLPMTFFLFIDRGAGFCRFLSIMDDGCCVGWFVRNPMAEARKSFFAAAKMLHVFSVFGRRLAHSLT